MCGRRSGWTIAEVLVVIAIIALLISLLLPALAGTRESSRKAMCLVQIRSSAQAVFGYAGDADGLVPGLGRSGPIEGLPEGDLSATIELPPSMGGATVNVDYFHQSYLFNVLLELAGIGPLEGFSCPHHPTGQMLFRDDPQIAYSTYTLPESFAADPTVFDPELEGPADVSLARLQRVHDVRFPSRKVFLFERRLFHERGQWSFREAVPKGIPVPTAMSDGHAAMVTYPSPLEVAPNRLRESAVTQPMATVNGVLGADTWKGQG